MSISLHPTSLETKILYHSPAFTFWDLLDLYNLAHVTLPTHIHENTLNLIISIFSINTLSPTNLSIAICDRFLNDFGFSFPTHSCPPPQSGPAIRHCRFGSKNIERPHHPTAWTSHSVSPLWYLSPRDHPGIYFLLSLHASLMSKTLTPRQSPPWLYFTICHFRSNL